MRPGEQKVKKLQEVQMIYSPGMLKGTKNKMHVSFSESKKVAFFQNLFTIGITIVPLMYS